MRYTRIQESTVHTYGALVTKTPDNAALMGFRIAYSDTYHFLTNYRSVRVTNSFFIVLSGLHELVKLIKRKLSLFLDWQNVTD